MSETEISYQRLNSSGRIVVIGDVHGHYDGLVSILLTAGIVDERLQWVAGDTVVVQIGDIFGRGSNGKFCCDLLMNLQSQARKAGGRVVVLLGNHEAMITHNCFKYITLSEMYNFTSTLNFTDDPQEKFCQALAKENRLGRWLRELPTAIVIDDILFTHAGLEPYWAEYGIDKLNELMEVCMYDERDYQHFSVSLPIISPIGPLWNRRLISSTKEQNERMLADTLSILNVERMIVGHTPSAIVPGFEAGKTVKRYDDKLIGVDVGINPVYGGYCAWLEIIGGEMIERNTWSEKPIIAYS